MPEKNPTQIQALHHDFGKTSFTRSLKMHLYRRHVGTGRPLVKEVSHMPQHDSYSTYTQKGPTKCTKLLPDPKVLSHSDYVGLTGFSKLTVVFLIQTSVAAAKEHAYCRYFSTEISHWRGMNPMFQLNKT